jgi:glutaredoxin-dependent peroxiredoxin
MTIEKGQQAPAFTAYDNAKNKVNLSDYSGKNVVLLFFPFAFSSVCTAELCSVRDNITAFNNTNAQVFGISVDALYSLDRYKEELQLNFPLLSDFNKTVSKAYNVLYETFAYDMQGVSKRAAFVIDKNGIIQYAEVCASPGDQPNFEAIQETLVLLN